MKRVKVNAWNIALVFRNNNLVAVLTEGSHWINPFSEVVIYDMSKPMVANTNLNILLKNKDFVDATKIVEVKNNEIVLQFENGLLLMCCTLVDTFSGKV